MDERSTNQNPVEQGKGIAWLSYFGLLIIIPILLQKDNPYTKYHIKQGLVYLIASIVWSIIGFVVGLIPFIGVIIYFIGWIVLLIIGAIGVINAIKGKEEPLPFIGKYADRFNF